MGDSDVKYKIFTAIVIMVFTVVCFFGLCYYNKEVWGGYLLGCMNCCLLYEFLISSLRI